MNIHFLCVNIVCYNAILWFYLITPLSVLSIRGFGATLLLLGQRSFLFFNSICIAINGIIPRRRRLHVSSRTTMPPKINLAHDNKYCFAINLKQNKNFLCTRSK